MFLRHLLDISKGDFKSFLNMNVLINTISTEEIEAKINFFREGAFKFIGFLIIED